MNTEDTKTPNGGSKNNLYINNPDTGAFEINFLAIEERNPEKDSISGEAGSNSTVTPVEIGTLETDIMEKVGYVGITVKQLTPQIEKDIKEKAKKSQEARDELLEKKDKNNDGIDDRNQ